MSKYHSDDKSVFQKYSRKRKTIMLLLISMLFFLFLTGFIISEFDQKKQRYQEDNMFNDFDEFKKGKLTGGILSAMNDKINSRSDELDPKPVKSVEKKKEKVIKKGKNYEKDEEIIEKYASAMDAASETPLQTGRGRRNFTPGGKGAEGGVFIKSNKSENAEKELNIHNVEIKAKLEYSIRSTAASTIIATVIKGTENIPAGSKFYGHASGYINKRTQISFSKLVINQETYSVKGFAVSGKDPGIESEVAEISEENTKSSIKQGVVKTVSNLAVKLAGSAGSTGGDAASNTVDPAAGEIQRQQEANKMTAEYRVPAGTAFFIYLE